MFLTQLVPADEVCERHRRARLAAPPLTTHTGTHGDVWLPAPASVEQREVLAALGIAVAGDAPGRLVQVRLPKGWYVSDSPRSVCHGCVRDDKQVARADVFIDLSLPDWRWTLSARPPPSPRPARAPLEIDPVRWPHTWRRYCQKPCTKNLPSEGGSSSSDSGSREPSTGVRAVTADPPVAVNRHGVYTQEQRRAAIARFHEKRKRMTYRHVVRYPSRKRFADGRARVGGRFAKIHPDPDQSSTPVGGRVSRLQSPADCALDLFVRGFLL